jgi:methionine-rich copper-binding protein CopC
VRAARHRSHVRALVAWSIALLLLICPLPAFAHARLVRSSPASQAQVAAPPEHIELWFSELLEDGFNSVEVVRTTELTAEKRANLARDPPTVDRDDRTHLVVPVQRLAPGSYAVEWRVLSRDGHSATGRFTIQIRTPQ